MTHSEIYGNSPYMLRKKHADDLYLEIIDMRVRDRRVECLSRWNKFNSDGSFSYSFGYRWRKICGKGVFIPSLDRAAKDEHNLSLSICDPFTGKRNRIYLRDFKKE